MAKYGQFTGYEPHPEIPGAYNFQTDGGNPYMFAGPEADQLKARLDAANAATTVAGDEAAPGFLDQVGGAIKKAFTPQQAAAVSAPSPGPPGDRPVVMNEINTGIKLDAQGRPYKEVAGSRGTSKADLEKRATQGVATPTSESSQVTGAHPVNQDYLDSQSEQSQNQQMALNKERDATVSAEQAGQKVAEEQFAATAGQQQAQQGIVNDIQAQVGKAQQVRDQALKDYTGTKIDPERIFHGGGGFGRKLATALAAGVGAYGASINHTQNFAGQFVDNMINRDIAAQEADLRTKKDASDTALGDLVRRGMSLDQAKGTLRSIQNTWAQQQLALAKGSSNVDLINSKYDTLISQRQAQNDKEQEAYLQDAHGRATQTIQAAILHPQAGSTGGRQYLTPEQAVKLAGEKTGTEGSVAGTAKVLSDIEGGGKKTQGDQKAASAIATADTALKSLSDYKDDEIPQTLENQDIASSTYHWLKDTTLGAGASARGMPAKDRNLIQDTEAARGYVKSLTSVLSGQGALSGPESAAADKGLAPGATVGDIRRAVAILKRRAQSILDAGGNIDLPGQAAPQQ